VFKNEVSKKQTNKSEKERYKKKTRCQQLKINNLTYWFMCEEERIGFEFGFFLRKFI
jgi:hypothetical protein